MTMLTALWGDQPRHGSIVAIKGQVVKHFWPRSISEADYAGRRLDESGWDVYFAPSLFADTTRKKEQVRQVPALWVDADAGEGKQYATVRDAARGIVQWARRQGLPDPTHIVSSGNGAHCYWVLDQPQALQDWLPVAQQLKRALAVEGVVDDPGCTGDAARILRLPGTHNFKDPDNPKPVQLLIEREHRPTLQQISEALPRLGPQAAVGSGPTPDDEWAVPANYPPGDAARIADACGQMGYFRHMRGAVSEPFWRAGLSVLKRCEGADVLIHDWSKGDPRYDPEQTRKKADNTGGPATCQHFSEVNPGGCTGCPHAGSVTSPVQLGVAAPEPEEDEPEWKVRKSGQWVVTDSGIYRNPPATEDDPAPEPIQVTEVPIWVSEVREKARTGVEEDQASLRLVYRTLDGREKEAILRQSALTDTRTFRSWLGDYNIFVGVRSTKELIMYITDITRQHMKKRGAREYHNTLGWHEKGFVLGSVAVTPEGTQDALVQSSNPINQLQPRGDAQEWTRAVNKLDRKDTRPHQVAVLSGFASALYEPSHTQSAVLSLVGRSGAGKTLAARLALSIYGDPDLLAQGSSSTTNSVEQQLTSLKNVPHLLDEVTSIPAQRITDHIYVAANGQGKASLTRNREMRSAGSWALTPILTANHPVLEFSHDYVQEAHRRRLLELQCDSVFPSELGAELFQASAKHTGVVGEVYLREVARIREHIPRLMEKAIDRVQSWSRIPPENRFSIWTLAACLLGGQIARRLGLIAWDPEVALREATAELEEAISYTYTDAERVPVALAEFLNDFSRFVVHWSGDQQDLGEAKDAAVARWYSPKQVAVHQRRFFEFLEERRISRAAGKDFLNRVILKQGTRRLAPGAPPVRCLVIDAVTAGLTEEADDAGDGEGA